MLPLAPVTWASEHLLSRALAHGNRQKESGLRPSLAGFPGPRFSYLGSGAIEGCVYWRVSHRSVGVRGSTGLSVCVEGFGTETKGSKPVEALGGGLHPVCPSPILSVAHMEGVCVRAFLFPRTTGCPAQRVNECCPLKLGLALGSGTQACALCLSSWPASGAEARCLNGLAGGWGACLTSE